MGAPMLREPIGVYCSPGWGINGLHALVACGLVKVFTQHTCAPKNTENQSSMKELKRSPHYPSVIKLHRTSL